MRVRERGEISKGDKEVSSGENVTIAGYTLPAHGAEVATGEA